MNYLWLAAFALLLDRLIGDPLWLPHPVVAIGRFIAWFDDRFNNSSVGSGVLRWRGAWLAVCTVSIAWGVASLAVYMSALISHVFATLLEVGIVASTIAWKGLCDAGLRVREALREQGLDAGRQAIAQIVGRDTACLSEPEVVRATVETLAENIVDAVLAPVFFAILGGAPLALAYRAVNTLDSMVGYRNDRYRHFGMVSARLDDVCNWLPARLLIPILSLTVGLAGEDVNGAVTVMRRDARRHPSPNSGIPEAMMAGALGVQLGGLNYYGGVPSERATMGYPLHPLSIADITRAVRIVSVAGWIMLLLLVLGGWLWQSFVG